MLLDADEQDEGFKNWNERPDEVEVEIKSITAESECDVSAESTDDDVGTLYISHGTEVTFRATSVGDVLFPDDKPVWSGGGVNATGEVVTHTFNQSGMKTVTAESGTSKMSINVGVAEVKRIEITESGTGSSVEHGNPSNPAYVCGDEDVSFKAIMAVDDNETPDNRGVGCVEWEVTRHGPPTEAEREWYGEPGPPRHVDFQTNQDNSISVTFFWARKYRIRARTPTGPPRDIFVTAIRITAITSDPEPGHVLAIPLAGEPIPGEEQIHGEKTYTMRIIPEEVIIDDEMIHWSVSEEDKAEFVDGNLGREVTLRGKNAGDSIKLNVKIMTVNENSTELITMCSKSKDLKVIKVTANVPFRSWEGLDADNFWAGMEPFNLVADSYQWLAHWPENAGNEPEVNFTNRTNMVTGVKKARWFADPDSPWYADIVGEENVGMTPPPDIICTYKIAVAAIVDGARILSERRDWKVQVKYRGTIYFTTPPPPDYDWWAFENWEDTGFPPYVGEIEEITEQVGEEWRVSESKFREQFKRLEPKIYIYTPNTSQFYAKVKAHEQHHVSQYEEIPPWSDLWDIDDLYDRICDLSSNSHETLVTAVREAVNAWDEESAQNYGEKKLEMERQAIQVQNNTQPPYLNLRPEDVEKIYGNEQ